MTDKYLPIEDLANHLSVTVSTIRQWVKQGHIPTDCYIKVGAKTYRFDVPSVVEALKKGNQSEVESDGTLEESFSVAEGGFSFDDE
jgi:excisionase family DNA binding protein|tara:strand:+ start:1267 stop:1524 length:258 start_codon:yes stop_codon:yes gene_type:complete